VDIVNHHRGNPPRRPVRTLGPIIHNPQVVQSLDDKGVHSIEALDEIRKVARSSFARMGLRQNYQQAENKGLTVVDATCPLVTARAEQAKQLVNEGYHLVIFGTLNTLKSSALWVMRAARPRSSRNPQMSARQSCRRRSGW